MNVADAAGFPLERPRPATPSSRPCDLHAVTKLRGFHPGSRKELAKRKYRMFCTPPWPSNGSMRNMLASGKMRVALCS